MASYLPRFDVNKNRIQNPHVVILGAGASIAACPDGDLNGLILPSLQNVQEVSGIAEIINEIEAAEGSLGVGFEAKYSRLVEIAKYPDALEQINNAVRAYFAQLELPEGITIYDLLILGLREKDFIFTFNWDPFLLQAFRRCGRSTSTPSLHFLHGCVDVAICNTCRVKSNYGIPCPRCGGDMEPSKLLFPVTDKDYESDRAIKTEWDALRRALDEAYMVTIFGYSAPVTDVAARSILIEAFSKNRFREFTEVEVIDIRERGEIEKSWEDFFFSHHYGIFDSFDHSWIYKHFRRSCDAFAMATLQCHPVPENPPVGAKTLEDLQAIAKVLYGEEQNDSKFWEDVKNPFSTE
ncbi:MAG: hypothetical protein AB7I04_04355 [Pseudomonadales bacterium]